MNVGLKIACVQFEAEPAAARENVARMVEYAKEASRQGCDLVLFPELIVTGYLPQERIVSLGEPIHGPSVATLAQQARRLRIGLAFGLAELDNEQHSLFNSLVVLDHEGEVLAVHRKMHLWAQEKEWARAGTAVSTFDIAGTCCAGWICYDTRFPEVARLAALAGADLALVPAAWMGPEEEWEVALRARALDNSVFVAGADIISSDPTLRCHGRSMIVGPRGNVMARARPDTDGMIYAVLDPKELEKQRSRVPLLRDRRPELYRGLAN